MLSRLRKLGVALDPAGHRIRSALRGFSHLLDQSAAQVLDLGSGAAPYAGLFPHQRYVTADLAAGADVRCDATSLPFDSRAFDLVICTEVLEHVPDPDKTLQEIHRVLTSEGALALTTPLTWGVHESRDYHRWTDMGLRQLLHRNGFHVECLVPRGGIFLCLGEMLLVIPWHLFGGVEERKRWQTFLYVCTYALLLAPAWLLSAIDGLDRRRHFTHGYAALCRPAGAPEPLRASASR